jgi:hypothetical protein
MREISAWWEYMLADLFFGEEYLLPIKQEAAWTQELAWTFWRIRILLLFYTTFCGTKAIITDYFIMYLTQGQQ